MNLYLKLHYYSGDTNLIPVTDREQAAKILAILEERQPGISAAFLVELSNIIYKELEKLA